MLLKTTRNFGFRGYLLVFATTATFFFTNCKKDSPALPGNPAITDSTTTGTKGGGTTTPPIQPTPSTGTPLKNMFGVNAFAWDFFSSSPSSIDPTKMGLLKTFNGIRHYLDWSSLESAQGQYSFNPTINGSWNLDAIYSTLKADNMTALVDIKTCPDWFLASFPANQRDPEDVTAPYGSDLSDPASYILVGKVAFQFAARYGSNASVSKSLLSVDQTPRWAGDVVNTIKVGLNTVKYVEVNNEPDMWWKGPATMQTAEQYAANMSAFYDGNMGKLGKNVGIKNADPNMIVVMGGICNMGSAVQWVKDMVTWCAKNRGYKADGSVNLCFDVINYHYYSNATGSSGTAPELSKASTYADAFAAEAKSIKGAPPVWITENGFDINASSIQRAPAIGSKTAEVVQADWILRSSLMYIKHGISRLFFYQMYDNDPGNSIQYATCGLMASATTRRPSGNYLLQTSNLMGDYTYVKTLSASPMVDQYTNGTKTMWVLWMPTAKGSTATYSLNVGQSTATLYQLNPTGTAIKSAAQTATSNKLNVAVSETPVFVSN
jgi:hypothetical protein